MLHWEGIRIYPIHNIAEFTTHYLASLPGWVDLTPASVWTVLGVTSKSRYTALGLDNGAVYYFRVKAVRGAVTGPESDVAQVQIAA